MRTTAGLHVEPVEQVDRAARPLSRLLDRRLEAPAEVEDEVGVRDPLHVARGELEIVRLDARRSQVHDGHARTADLLRGERERIEGRDDVQGAGLRPLRAAAARERDRGGQRGHRRWNAEQPHGGASLARMGTVLIIEHSVRDGGAEGFDVAP